jgi:hypothetical protein
MLVAQGKRGTSAALGKWPKKDSSLSASDGERVGVRGFLEYVSIFTKRCT